MRTAQRCLQVTSTGCVGLLLVWQLLGTTLPSAQADPPPQNDLYLKSRLGLMPPAYGQGESQPQARLLDSSGLLNTHATYAVGAWPEVVGLGQLTADTRQDAAVAASPYFDPPNSDRLHLFAQTTTGTLSRTVRYDTGSNPRAIAVGDLDGDGRDDVVVANQGDDTLGVFWQSAGGTLSAMQTFPTGDAPDGVALGDFNGDCRLDVAVSHAQAQEIRIYHQLEGQTFASPVAYAIGSAGFNEIAAGDVDGDGDDDVVLLRGAGYATDDLAIFYQQEGVLGSPVFRTVKDGGYLAHGLALGDVTGDGRADVVAVAGGNTPDAYLNVFAQSSDGTLASMPTTHAAYHLPEVVEVGDVNHDGRNDAVVLHAAWQTLSVYTQTLAGAFSTYDTYALPYVDHYQPQALALGDLNSDGSLDVAIADSRNGLVVLTNTLTAPLATVDYPPCCTSITAANHLITGTVTGASQVQLSLDNGHNWQTIAASGGVWSYNWNVAALHGAHRVWVRAVADNGRVQAPPVRRCYQMVHDYLVYLPTVFRSYQPPTHRDLTVTRVNVLSTDPAMVEVVIENLGSAAVTPNFWVDLYVDPNPPPAAPGDLWDPPRCSYGGSWFVDTDIAAYGSLALSTSQLDPDHSYWPDTLPPGSHVLYVQVDSYGGPQGYVLEDNEDNNIAGPTAFAASTVE
jgi:hypothetical protein